MGKKADLVNEKSIAEAWDEELLRRLELVKSGKAVLQDWDEFKQDMEEALRKVNEERSSSGGSQTRGH